MGNSIKLDEKNDEELDDDHLVLSFSMTPLVNDDTKEFFGISRIGEDFKKKERTLIEKYVYFYSLNTFYHLTNLFEVIFDMPFESISGYMKTGTFLNLVLKNEEEKTYITVEQTEKYETHEISKPLSRKPIKDTKLRDVDIINQIIHTPILNVSIKTPSKQSRRIFEVLEPMLKKVYDLVFDNKMRMKK